MEEKTIRVLMVLPGLNVCGGMESFIMNYFRNINRERVMFDFVTHNISENSYVEEIQSLGGIIYQLPPFSLKSVKTIKKRVKQILAENDYKIIHCHMANAAFLYLSVAKKAGIPIRILHSHQDKAADSFAHAVRNVPLIYFGLHYCNYRIACSNIAGRYLFKNQKYTIVNNAINYEDYEFNSELRDEVRRELGFTDEIVIGHTGRLCPQKNQLFLLKIMKKLKDRQFNVKLMLIGEGEDRDYLEHATMEMGLSNYVTFLGARKDIRRLLQAMDLFVFPSIYEGLGISVLEAQAASLLTYCSTGVPDEANISGEMIYLSLDKGEEYWTNQIVTRIEKGIERNNERILSKEYDIREKADELTKLYLELEASC